MYNRFTAPIRRNTNADRNKLSVIILGALPSYKMRSYGPKGLIKLSSGDTILDSQLNSITLIHNVCDVVLTVGFQADKIIRHCPTNVRIVENQLFEQTNILEELRLALNNVVTDRVLFVSGEMLFDAHIIEILTKSEMSTILVDDGEVMTDDDVGVTIVDDRATILSHDIKPKWAFLLYLVNKELKLFKSICSDRDKNKLYMFEAINYVLEKGGQIKPVHNKGKLYKVDSSKGIV